MEQEGIRMIIRNGRWLLTLALLFASAPSGAAENVGFGLSVGGEYTNGDYGTGQDTTIWYFPLGFRADIDEHSVSLTLPFVATHGPGNVVPSVRGGSGIFIGGPAGTTDTEAGIGDLLLTGTLNIIGEDQLGPRMDITAKIKFGTADRDHNLGTGEEDYSLQLDFERSFSSNSLFGSFGYRLMGDPPGVNLRDVLFGSIGGEHRFSDTTAVGLSLGAEEEVVSGGDPALDLTLFLSSQADARTKVTGYALKGIEDGSPDWGAGLIVKFSQ